MVTPISGPITTAVRPLGAADREAAGLLGREAFGFPADLELPHPDLEAPGRRSYGSFVGVAGDDRLVAKLVDREFDSWFGGAAVPTAGIAGVSVPAEHRGQGLLAPLVATALAEARARGALVSGLFASALGVYRPLGYELVGSLDTVAVPATALAAVPAPTGVTLRRGSPADAEAVLECYRRWARAQNGPLTRRGGSVPDSVDRLTSSSTTVTVAERDGTMIGYACWSRGVRTGEHAELTVDDFVALDREARAALLHTLGSFRSVVPTILIRTSGVDLARLLLRSNHWQPRHADLYMIKILDVAGFLSRLRYPALAATVEFTVAGDMITGNDGGYRLTVTDGVGRCERVEVPGGPVFTPQGLVLVSTGAQSCANTASRASSAARKPTTRSPTHCSVVASCTSGTSTDVRRSPWAGCLAWVRGAGPTTAAGTGRTRSTGGLRRLESRIGPGVGPRRP